MSFSDDIKRFRAKALKAADKIFRGSCLEVFGAIIRRTPVDTGRLRGNWQCELNSIPGGTVDAKTDSLRGAQTKVAAIKITDSAYLINNLPYAQRIETGYSQQAPAGMVKVTIAEWNRIVSSNASKQ